MKVLILAPVPFFQERGTPIAVKLATEVLGARGDLQVEVLCYPEGKRGGNTKRINSKSMDSSCASQDRARNIC